VLLLPESGVVGTWLGLNSPSALAKEIFVGRWNEARMLRLSAAAAPDSSVGGVAELPSAWGIRVRWSVRVAPGHGPR
jgi:hypothetical protein